MFSPNPSQMAKIMRQMGIKTKEINCKRVIIEQEDGSIIIEPAQVVEIEMKGIRTYQISGEVKEKTKLREEDIQIVMEQTSCSRERAIKALEDAEGDTAEAILSLKNE